MAVSDAASTPSFRAKPVIAATASSPGSRISTNVRSPAPSATSFDFINISRAI